MTIEQAQSKDLIHIAALFDAYRVFYQQASDLQLALQFIQQRYDLNESVIFYAQDEHGNYVGFTQLYPSFSSVSAKRSWILNDLYVSKEYRSSGIGTLLLNKAKEFAIATQAKGIALETAASNIRAQKLYESLGYHKDTEISYFLNVQN
ncbi:MAG TPA: GNAT family N-acetyltransferase [Oceanospirillales bacterium]|nr:GNAT family N-acetyltransferase [Oceanospirillales bacterium]